MQIPPFYKYKSYQIFILGALSGAIIAYIVLLYMHGKMYENVLVEQVELKMEIKEIRKQNEILIDDKEEMEAQSEATVKGIQINFENAKELKFDRLSTLQLENMVKNELANVIGKTIQSVSESDDLLVTVIENKTFTIDDYSYQFEVKKISISEQIKLTLEGEIEN